MKAKNVNAIFFSILLAGCAGSPVSMSMMSAEQLALQDNIELCNAYHHMRTEKIKAELESRNLFNEREWQAINQNAFYKGMSVAALVCSIGLPGVYGDINRSSGDWGSHAQWVYRSCNACKATYIYTENGVVTAWQK